MPGSDRKLLASIHDVSPRFRDEIDFLADRLARQLDGPRFALLVVPNHWGEAPIAGDIAFQRRLRDWAMAGAEIFVHGWYHRDQSTHGSPIARFKARHMTAREGEFLGLDENSALRRMLDGRALIEDIIGMPVAGFIAPAWLYGRGAIAALPKAGFTIAEDHMRVWRCADGKSLAKGPVITWASRSRARIRSSLAFSALARHAFKPLPTVRVAVHPGDTKVPALLASISACLETLLPGHRPARYADLILSSE